MDLELAGKTALVTGSSRGIGRSIAAALLAEGCRVVLNGRDEISLKETARDLNVDAVPGDVTTKDGAHRVIQAVHALCAGLDVLVCNVGSGASVPPGSDDEVEWQRVLGINLLSATNTVAAARPIMKEQGGSILCISSICGSAALGAPIAYSAAKAALDSFVRGSSRYLAKENIRINALAPGNILFPGSTWEKKMQQDKAAVEQMLTRDVALARLGRADEVASMAVFLCSPRASFATGAVYVLDGGQLRS